MSTALCLRKRMVHLLEALTCSYSGALRLVGEWSYMAKSPLVRPFPLEAWCWSTGIAVPFSFRSHDSRICVALNAGFTRPLRELPFVFLLSSALHYLFLFLYFLLLFFVYICPLVLLLFRFLPSFLVFFVYSFIFLFLLQLVLH